MQFSAKFAYTIFDLLLQPAAWVHELLTSLPAIVAHTQRQRSRRATLARVHGARPCRAIRCMPYCCILLQSCRAAAAGTLLYSTLSCRIKMSS